MLCHIRNTFQTRFSSQENCSVYRDTFATLNYTRYSNFFYPNLFKPLLSGQKRKKRKKISLNEIATRQNNPVCEERRESVGAVNQHRVQRGLEGWSRSNGGASDNERPGALDRPVSRAEIVHRGCRWLYAGFLRTRGWVMVVPISSVHSLLRSPSRATIFQ